MITGWPAGRSGMGCRIVVCELNVSVGTGCGLVCGAGVGVAGDNNLLASVSNSTGEVVSGALGASSSILELPWLVSAAGEVFEISGLPSTEERLSIEPQPVMNVNPRVVKKTSV
jgi:hypothetical protein